jgi:hypothetical protein
MSKEKATQKDAVFDASIEFIKTLTGMEPPPIEIAPPEVLKPFREFTEKVCSIFHDAPPQRTWVRLTNEDLKPICDEWRIVYGAWMVDFARDIEIKLKEKNS